MHFHIGSLLTVTGGDALVNVNERYGHNRQCRREDKPLKFNDRSALAFNI